MRARYYEEEVTPDRREPDGQDSEPCECGGVIDYWDCGDQSWDDPGTPSSRCRECGESDRG